MVWRGVIHHGQLRMVQPGMVPVADLRRNILHQRLPCQRWLLGTGAN